MAIQKLRKKIKVLQLKLNYSNDGIEIMKRGMSCGRE